VTTTLDHAAQNFRYITFLKAASGMEAGEASKIDWDVECAENEPSGRRHWSQHRYTPYLQSRV